MPEPLDYSVRRSGRARRVQVQMTPDGGVEVVLPNRSSERAAAAAVAELRPWIEARRAEAAAVRRRVQAPAGHARYLDELLRLVEQPGRTRVHRRGAELLVPAGDHGTALERWYRRAARTEIAGRLDRATAAAGVTTRACRFGLSAPVGRAAPPAAR